MSHRHHRHHAPGPPALAPAPAPAPAAERSRAIEELHPVLLDLLLRMNILPPGDVQSLSEAALANAVSLAISMLPEDEQIHIVSRIMSDDEIAQERLDHPRLQNLGSRVVLSQNERRLLLRASPEPDDDDAGQGEAGANACIICFDRNAVAVPCGCRYCAGCLRELVRVGLRSEADFPPRCCRPFDEATIRLTGRPALVHLFRQLSAEYAVPAAQRLYCHNPGCATFLPPSAIQAAARDEINATAVGTCPSCSSATCRECGGRSHRGLPCRAEGDDEALWDMMDANGLVGCPECGIVITLMDGCNHMTCVCGAEFCFLCGEDWEFDCNCPLYNARELRVPIRRRPGRWPITRGGRAHLADGSEQLVPNRVPRLRYDPEDEVALAALDEGAIIPLPAPAPAPARAPPAIAPARAHPPAIAPARVHPPAAFAPIRAHDRARAHAHAHDRARAPPPVIVPARAHGHFHVHAHAHAHHPPPPLIARAPELPAHQPGLGDGRGLRLDAVLQQLRAADARLEARRREIVNYIYQRDRQAMEEILRQRLIVQPEPPGRRAGRGRADEARDESRERRRSRRRHRH
ncbi:hypothetical protein J3F83DRAFT_762164 [Trichoderma novae-zelandiae]